MPLQADLRIERRGFKIRAVTTCPFIGLDYVIRGGRLEDAAAQDQHLSLVGGRKEGPLRKRIEDRRIDPHLRHAQDAEVGPVPQDVPKVVRRKTLKHRARHRWYVLPSLRTEMEFGQRRPVSRLEEQIQSGHSGHRARYCEVFERRYVLPS